MKRVIYYLLTLLGFGAAATSCCGDLGDGGAGDQVAMYGVPVIFYRISARVVDADGNPIKGIEAKALYDLEYADYYYAVGYSDVEGVINTEQTSGITPPYLQLKDIDGEANGGEFETLTLELGDSFTEPADPSGFYVAELGDVTMAKTD